MIMIATKIPIKDNILLIFMAAEFPVTSIGNSANTSYGLTAFSCWK